MRVHDSLAVAMWATALARHGNHKGRQLACRVTTPARSGRRLAAADSVQVSMPLNPMGYARPCQQEVSRRVLPAPTVSAWMPNATRPPSAHMQPSAAVWRSAQLNQRCNTSRCSAYATPAPAGETPRSSP